MMNNTQKLLRYFGLNISRKDTIRQISLETKIPYMTLNRIIKKLEKDKIIITEKGIKAADGGVRVYHEDVAFIKI